ncbi:alcohol dehydrogenase catalytic domain-containing protein [Kitasatospora sp. NPDC093806]|uniref:zinc-dependent alcohol dehydrogenase n=1 Tax=Kitasatospora sp. NPDC093806 TaxID=3155075 RepID=UPI003447C9A9
MTGNARVALWDGEGISLRDVTLPDHPHRSRVEVVATGICGTDLHVLKHGPAVDPQAPLSLGHEIVARVERVAPGQLVVGAERVSEGDLVVLVPGAACGRCAMCQSFGAHEHLCPSRVVHGFSTYRPDGDFAVGGFASRISVAEGISLVKVPEGLDRKRAALAELTSVAVRAVERALGQGRPDIGMGSLVGGTAAVLGTGPVGATVALVLRAAGMDVRCFEPGEWRAAYAARELGLDVQRIDGGTDYVAGAVADTPYGLGFDVVIECAGEPAAFGAALELARRGGRVVELGHFISTGTLAVDPSVICRKDLEVVGSVLAPPTAYPKAMRLLQREDLPFDRIISQEIGLGGLTDLATVLGERDHMKRVVDPAA